MENIGLALQLMVVGMVTVFIILMIVIQLGKWLIQIVNKVAPEETVAPKRKKAGPPNRNPAPGTATAIDAQTLAVIREAVSQITGGKGSVSKVERL